MNKILIGTGYDDTMSHRWSYCYLDGEIQDLIGHDIFLANVEKPTEPGVYDCTFVTDTGLWHECVATIEQVSGEPFLSGLVTMKPKE